MQDSRNLSEYGIKEIDFENIAEKEERASSMKGNPIELTKEELLKILRKSV